MKKNVCILIEQLSGGGAERVAGMLSSILVKQGYDVSVVVLIDSVKYPHSGHLINLGQYKNGSRSFFSKLGRYVQLHNVLRQHNFDVVLDFRMKNFAVRELLLNLFVLKRPMVNMVRSQILDYYFPKPVFLSKMLYKNYFGIVCVAKKMRENVEFAYGFKNVHYIYNPVNIDFIQEQSRLKSVEMGDHILAVGRHHPVKQFKGLVNAYLNSQLPQNNIKLLIIGDDLGNQDLANHIKRNNAEKFVELLPFQDNPFPYYKNARFLVLSSKNEGFPGVLLEALACGIPLVSFNCPSGPSEIVNHEKNGLLVKDQDFDALTKAIDRLVADEKLYQVCKVNSVESVERFSIKNIGLQWNEFLKTIGK